MHNKTNTETTRRPQNSAKMLSCYKLIVRLTSIALIAALLLATGSEAIVKQPRSDDLSSSSGGSTGYQSHQVQSAQSSSSQSSSMPVSSSASGPSVASGASQQQQPSYSSSISVSSSSSPASSGSGASATSGSSNQQSGYSSYGPSSSQKQQLSSYVDSLASAAAANAPDSSYQAAASNVNMALANSGIFGTSGSAYATQQQSTQQQQSQQQQSLNPLHYFYYPSKESQQNQPKQATASGADAMMHAASSNYQSMAPYPTYADQPSGALGGAANPDAAASSQDPSYLPQPAGNGQNGADLSALFNGNNQGNQMMPQQQQHQPSGQQQQPQNQFNSDLGAYSSNQQPSQQVAQQPQLLQQQQSTGSISFQGPSSSGNQQQPSGSDFSSGQQQQVAPMSAYQGSSFYTNQMGDLSTSNFGNNAGGLSSVASYMSPQQQQQQQVASSQQPHDLFSGSGLNQFSSAASQLAPASVSPPGLGPLTSQQQQAVANSQSLFGPNSLFGSGQQSVGPSQQSNQNMFANQHYLSSFLSPQQYGQLSGQMDPSQHQLATSGSSPAASVATASGGSSKRFGIGSFIMPMLALAGLSLLIPTMSNIGTAVGRKKRSIGEDKASGANRQQQIAFDPINGVSQLAKEISIPQLMDKIDRYYSIYKDAVENDDCLNRLICEFGDAVKDINGKSVVVTVIEKLAPNWMTGRVHLFKDAALDNKEGKEKCKKYVCHSGKQH